MKNINTVIAQLRRATVIADVLAETNRRLHPHVRREFDAAFTSALQLPRTATNDEVLAELESRTAEVTTFDYLNGVYERVAELERALAQATEKKGGNNQ